MSTTSPRTSEQASVDGLVEQPPFNNSSKHAEMIPKVCDLGWYLWTSTLPILVAVSSKSLVCWEACQVLGEGVLRNGTV